MRIDKSLLIICCFIGFGSSAQDMHFSQISQMPLLLNPGATGMMDGWMRASLQHRNQWVGSNGKYNNTLAAVDFNMLKEESYSKGYLGIGAFFYNDGAGDGNYGKQSGSVSFSGALPMGRGGNHVLSLGLQAGFASTSINGQNLIFESQWDGSSYDPSVLSGEPIVPTYSYSDVSTGLFYTVDGSNNTFAGKSQSKFTLGVALFHANKPKIRYTIGSFERLNRKLVVHSSYVKDIAGSKIQLTFDGAQFFQGKQSQTILGGMFGYKFKSEGNFSGASSILGFGLHMRSLLAVIPSVMIQHKGFQFQVSYDATVSAWRKAEGGGSLEFSLVYTYFNKGLFADKKFK
jgi:type IX secretion system PorP/SprF family membrane protein